MTKEFLTCINRTSDIPRTARWRERCPSQRPGVYKFSTWRPSSITNQVYCSPHKHKSSHLILEPITLLLKMSYSKAFVVFTVACCELSSLFIFPGPQDSYRFYSVSLDISSARPRACCRSWSGRPRLHGELQINGQSALNFPVQLLYWRSFSHPAYSPTHSCYHSHIISFSSPISSCMLHSV